MSGMYVRGVDEERGKGSEGKRVSGRLEREAGIESVRVRELSCLSTSSRATNQSAISYGRHLKITPPVRVFGTR